MHMPKYDGLIEQWKVGLVVARAKRMGFRRHEVPDVLQTIVPELLEFEYDPNHANGAHERSALVPIIDNHLRKMIRSGQRYTAHLERLAELTAERYDHVDARAMDVAEAVARHLPPVGRRPHAQRHRPRTRLRLAHRRPHRQAAARPLRAARPRRVGGRMSRGDSPTTGLLDPPARNVGESTGFQGQDEEHGTGPARPPGRLPSTAWVSDELLADTIEVWSEAYGRSVSKAEAMEILMNVKRLGEALLKARQEMN